jgi:hypothetical protein
MITANVADEKSSNIITNKGFSFNIPNSYTGRSYSLSNSNEFMIGGGKYSGGFWIPSLFHFKYMDKTGSSSSVTTLSFSGDMSASSRISFEILDKVGTKIYISTSSSNVLYFGEITFSTDWATLENSVFYTFNCLYSGTCLVIGAKKFGNLHGVINNSNNFLTYFSLVLTNPLIYTVDIIRAE